MYKEIDLEVQYTEFRPRSSLLLIGADQITRRGNIPALGTRQATCEEYWGLYQ